jgi:hypothetical protein
MKEYVIYFVVIINILIYLLHGAESFLRTNRFSASQEIPRIFLEPGDS